MYVVFICIAAYGVVSRAMTMHGEIEFTVTSITTNIFYTPYWFLYSDTEEEKEALNRKIIQSQ